jgi:catechol 2,3-dioxygenase-like lactoylglutathione lyase family enzyme
MRHSGARREEIRMIGYVTLGTNDLERAGTFYDSLFSELGAARLMTNERLIMWGTKPDQPMLAVCIPYDEKPATGGNGTMVALNGGSRAEIDVLHAKALELGATDEGAPGPRGDANFYGGYFRDLDGNKFISFVMGGE